MGPPFTPQRRSDQALGNRVGSHVPVPHQPRSLRSPHRCWECRGAEGAGKPRPHELKSQQRWRLACPVAAPQTHWEGGTLVLGGREACGTRPWWGHTHLHTSAPPPHAHSHLQSLHTPTHFPLTHTHTHSKLATRQRNTAWHKNSIQKKKMQGKGHETQLVPFQLTRAGDNVNN